MMIELKEKLKTEVEQSDWAPLKQHHDNHAVYIVTDLELLDAAVAVALDKVEFIKLWLESGSLREPTEQEVAKWDAKPNLKMAKFIIIQPYVLISLIED
jgi:hypothetical protein